MAQFGSCSFNDISNFAGNQPGNCGPSILTVVIPDSSTPQQLDGALSTFCRTDCGEVFIEHLILQCNFPGFAFALTSFCLPTRNTSSLGNFCQHSIPGRVDLPLINMFAPCSDFPFQSGCSNECATGLAAVRGAVTRTYNTTGILQGYLQAGLISQANVTLFESIISNYSLV